MSSQEYNDRVEGETRRDLIYEIFEVRTDSGVNEWLGHSYISSKRDYESVLLFMLDKYRDIEGNEETIKFLEKLRHHFSEGVN